MTSEKYMVKRGKEHKIFESQIVFDQKKNPVCNRMMKQKNKENQRREGEAGGRRMGSNVLAFR